MDLYREDSLASFSHRTTPHDSRLTTPYSSRPVSPYSSRVSSPTSSRPVTPSTFYTFEDEDSGLPSETDKSYEDIAKPKKKLHRTLSLPDSELNHLSSEELHDRFTTLQLEQENRSLKKLTEELQFALEKLEERVNEMHEEKSKDVQRCEVDSLDEPLPKQIAKPTTRHLDIPLESPQYHKQQLYEQPKPHKKKSHDKQYEPKRAKTKSKQHKKDQGNCCIS